ncbi:MAG: guanylate kinase [Deltaproteobacteria bacterium]|nr:guanylate kinase [Deltaproteobacteria bacterium]
MPIDLTRWVPPDDGALFVVSGASGVGKTTLVREALARIPHLVFSVSATTRAPRSGEVEGVDYTFVSEARFDALVGQDAFLEHATVYGNRYGTLREPVAQAVARGTSVLLDIDVQGAAQVRSRWPGAVTLFVLPPSLEVLAERLKRRGTDAPDVLERRIRQAHLHLASCGSFDYLVLNDRLEAACDQLQAILVAELLKRGRRASWVRRFTQA